MKVRTGFVSNSSSSSFCLVGAKAYDNQILRLAKELGLEIIQKEGEDEWETNNRNMDRVCDALEAKGMEVHIGEEHIVFGYPVETDTTIDSQIDWVKNEFEEIGIKRNPCFDFGEVCSG